MPSRELNERTRVRAGGQSTNYGILYQLLSILLAFAKGQIEKLALNADGFPESFTIVLEPASGGDYETFGSRLDPPEVVQVKARSTGLTWSLKDVIESVLPDLYRAARVKDQGYKYRFIIEGRVGNWEGSLDFFREFGRTNCINRDDLQRPDEIVGFSHGSSPFWERGA